MRGNIFKLISFSVAVFMFSCKQTDIEDFPETVVIGIVRDENLNTVVSGAKVYVWEYRITDDLIKPQRYRHKIVDSAISDASGKYALKFKTSSAAVSYEPSFKLSDRYYFMYPSKELQRGVENTVNLSAYSAVILKARITYTDNAYPPLNIYTSSQVNPSWTLSSVQIKKNSADTTIMLKVIPNKINYLTFSYNNGYTPYFYSDIINPPLLPDTVVKTFNLILKDFKR